MLSELHVIDHYEASGFAAWPLRRCSQIESRIEYGRDYLPHDAAMARELGTGRSIFETMKALSLVVIRGSFGSCPSWTASTRPA